MKLAVIGNSHSVALRLGWDLVPEAERPAGLAVSFFAMGNRQIVTCGLDEAGRFGPLDRFAGQEAHDEALRQARAFGPSGKVDPAAFDVVVLVGAPDGTAALLRLLAAVDVDGVIETGRRTVRLSAPAFRRIRDDLIARALPEAGWARWADRPLVLVPEPLFLDRLLRPETPEALGRGLQELLREGQGAEALVLAFREAVAERTQAETPFRLPGPPPECRGAAPFLTDESFARGAKRLNGLDQPETDYQHLNAEYGRLYWPRILKALGL